MKVTNLITQRNNLKQLSILSLKSRQYISNYPHTNNHNKLGSKIHITMGMKYQTNLTNYSLCPILLVHYRELGHAINAYFLRTFDWICNITPYSLHV